MTFIDMYGREWKSDITRGIIEPLEIDSKRPDLPQEWLEPVDTPDAMSNLIEGVRKDLKKSKRIRILKTIGAGLIEVAGEVFPVLKPLTSKVRSKMPKRFKPFLTQKSTWEGVAALAGAVGITFYPDAALQIVTGVFLIIGGLEMWKREEVDE